MNYSTVWRFYLAAAVFYLSASVSMAFAENWPGFEGTGHRSSSSISISPDSLEVKWTIRFDRGDPKMLSRNLALLNGKLAIVAATSNEVPPKRACVTILDAKDGKVLNCLTTEQGFGDDGRGATDTLVGEQVLAWDADTGYLFLSIGTDSSWHTAIDPLANIKDFKGVPLKAKGAYEELVAKFPDIRSCHTSIHYRNHNVDDPKGITRAKTYHHGQPNGMRPDQWDSGSKGIPYNFTSFFEVQPGSPYLAVVKDTGHNVNGQVTLINKHTGLCALYDGANLNIGMMGLMPFKWYGPLLVAGNYVYGMGPYKMGVADKGWSETYAKLNQGLRLTGVEFRNVNKFTEDGGYNGPGADETAEAKTKLFDYKLDAVGPGSWEESDSVHRNKAFLQEGSGVWAAWKPGKDVPAQLVHATPTEVKTYDLSVGKGITGGSIWTNIAFAQIGDAKYVVYLMLPSNTPGPMTVTVFDANTVTEKWTYELNNAQGNGNYPNFPVQEHGRQGEKVRMVVAGKYAYVAWVDNKIGAKWQLKVLGIDITAPKPPAKPPTPFAFDLESGAVIPDMIAADGFLYVNVRGRTQQIVAIGNR